MRRFARGQAVTELALGMLVLVPMLLIAIYLAETFAQRLEATEAATEPLWDATSMKVAHQSYTGAFDRTAEAVTAAKVAASRRMTGRSLVFTQASAPRIDCQRGGGLDLQTLAAPGSIFKDGGGIACDARMTVGAKGLTRFFLDQGRGAMFNEPLNNLRRQFDFCGTRTCRPFWVALGDWGLLDQGTEPDECRLTMDTCANQGFFKAAKGVYQATRRSGTRATTHLDFVTQLVRVPPEDFARVTDFQMSYRGEAGFIETVPVVEGDRDWRTTPSRYNRALSYANRSERFLGL